MKIWIVTTCIPEPGEGPCIPSPFATEAEAEAYADKMMRDEWASHGPENERTGKRKRYPGDWREAQDIIAEHFSDGSWGTWQVTCHDVPDPVRDAAPEMLAALKLAHQRLYIANCEGEEDEHLATIEAAISKAEGRGNG
jgi:hypothetical protein